MSTAKHFKDLATANSNIVTKMINRLEMFVKTDINTSNSSVVINVKPSRIK